MLTIPPHAPPPDPPRRARSSQIEAVRAAPHLVDTLWRRVQSAGTPLIEGHGGTRTYTWVHRGPAERVLLVLNKIVDDRTFESMLLERVDGTDLWALSLEFGAGWRSSYSLAVDDGNAHGDPTAREALDAKRARALSVTPAERHEAIHAWYDLLALARPDPLARETDGSTCVVSGPDAPTPLEHVGHSAGHLVPVDLPADVPPATWFLPHGPPPPGGWDLLVLLDGDEWIIDRPTIFDDLIGTGTIAPTAALAVGHGNLRERVAELACSPALVDRLIDLIRSAPVPVTDDPDRTTIVGQSLGGLSALFAQCLAPARFGTSICQSGSFWWPNPLSGEAPEWLTRTIEQTAPRLRRVHLEVGRAEWVLLGPTRRLRDVLTPLSEQLTYSEFDGGHDSACWSAGLPAALRRHLPPALFPPASP